MSPEEQIQRYKCLLETARCFGRAMDVGTLIDEILDRSKEVIHAQACTLLLPSTDSEDLVLHSTDPRLSARREPLKVPAGQGFAGFVFKNRETLNIADAQADPRHYQPIGQEVGIKTRAIITIPLLDGARCLGVLQALNPQQRDRFDSEDQEIFEGFGGLIVNALLRIEAQRREIDRAQAAQELQLAREIQDSFLPAGVQAFPFARIHLQYSPARLVGGDFYFVHAIGADRLLMGLGDVTGKGVPAALTMARATAIIQALVAQIGADLGEWVTLLNRELARDLKAGRFIGMTFLLADAAASALQICAAGQFPPFHFDGEQWSQSNPSNHLPLGILAEASYQAEKRELKPGARWVLVSDGITEARNRRGEELTPAGFLAMLPAGEDATNTIDQAMRAWRKFVGSAPNHDDASVLLLDWRGLPPPAELNTTCCPENLSLGRDFVERWASYGGYPDVVIGQIVLACDEAVSNIFRHGYGKKPGPLTFEAKIAEASLCFRITDEAKPIDASKIKARDPADVRPGGLGTFIISQVFDEVTYQPHEIGTVLTLRKKLPASAA